MTDTMPPSTRSDEALLATARQYAPVGWRPTHTEILRLLAIIDRLTERQPIGYLIVDSPSDSVGSEIRVRGDDGPVSSYDQARLFLAPPVPVEYAHDERVVAVYELPA